MVDTKIIIERAKQVHGDKYDYSKTIYTGSNNKICIICPEHGEFWMKSGNHINGKQGCPQCGLLKRAQTRSKTTQQFISEAQKKHNYLYDYSKVSYVNDATKVCIICPEHGEFWQTPTSHLQGNGCPLCNGGAKYTKETFINKAIKIHGNKYDYSKVEYKNATTKVCIICPEHGEFWQTPATHLKGSGCPKCVGKNKTTQSFIEHSNIVHNNKYDYSKVEYKGAFKKVCIICPEHGEFWQTPHSHLRGSGCAKCFYERAQDITKQCANEFVEKAIKIHGDKYDYSKVEYKNATTKVCIICPEHGEFWQTPNKHLNGNGCFKCKESKLEEKMRLYLEAYKISYIQEKKFDGLNARRFDFFLPEYNTAIECQGLQHFKPVEFFDNTKFSLTEYSDKEKNIWCNRNNVKILYFINKEHYELVPFNNGIYTIENTFFDLDKLNLFLKI